MMTLDRTKRLFIMIASFIVAVAMTRLACSAVSYPTVTVLVVDASDGHVIGNATVLLAGAQPLSALTDAHGTAVLYDVTPGAYGIAVSADHYKSFTQTNVSISGAVAAVSLTIALAKTSLSTIATMQVRNTKYGSLGDPFEQFNQDLKRLLPDTSLGAALDSLSNPSINGHDGTATSFLIDGLPINAPRFAAQLNGFDNDLITGSDISAMPSQGFAGGTVNLETIYPTLSWTKSLSDELDSYGGGAYSAKVTGTAGFTGIAVQHADRWSGGPLNGLTYYDSSGLDYAHSQTSSISGTALVLQGAIGAMSFRARHLNSRSTADVLCLTIANNIPCGYGPGNHSSETFRLDDLHGSSLVAGNEISIDVASTTSFQSSDMSARILAGSPAPYLQQNRTAQTFGRILAERSLGVGDFLSAGLSYSSSHDSWLSSHGSDLLDSASGERFLSANLSEHHDLGNGRSVSTALLASGGGNYSQTGFEETYSQRISATDTLRVASSGYSSDSRASVVQTIPDPFSLQFNCSTATAYGSGPSFDPSGRQNSIGLDVSYARETKRGGMSLEAYSQRQQGLSVAAPVSAVAFASVLPAGFFSTAEDLFASVDHCGVKALQPSNIFLTTTIPGVHGVYSGVRASGYGLITPHIVVSGLYDYTSARDISSSDLLHYSSSTIISGAQLPGIPVHDAHLTVAYLNNADFRAVLDAKYTGTNNANNLPAYVLANFGLSSQIGSATITASVYNLFNRYPGNFTSSANAVPLATDNGAGFPTLATPLGPRTIRVVATFGLGPRHDPAQVAAHGTLLDRMLGFGIPGVVPLNDRYMRTLGMDAARSGCQESVRQRLQPLLRSLSADYSETSGQMSAPRAVVQRDSTDAKTIFLMPLDPYLESDLEVCSAIHFGNVEQAARMGLPVPPPSIGGSNSIGYNDRVGFYEVLGSRAPRRSEGEFRYYPFGSPTPDNPFGTENRCPIELRPAANTLLNDLKQAITRRRSSDAWTLIGDTTNGSIGVRATVGNSLAIIFDCAHVTGVSEAQVSQLHLTPQPLPDLNFSKTIGLYIEQ